MKKEKIKGYAVVCNNPIVNNSVFAFVQKNSAQAKKEVLDKEFSGHCIHKVIPCEIILTPQ